MFEDDALAGRSPHPVGEVLDAAEAVFDRAGEVDAWSVSDDDLLEVLLRCHALAARQAELFLRLLAEADTRDVGRRMGASSTTAWIRDVLRIRPGVAKASVDLAHRLKAPAEAEDYAANPGVGAGGRSMPATAAALAAGQVSVDHATVISKTMAQLPTDVSSEDAANAEADLAAFAREYDPGTLQRLATHLLHVLSTESLEQREERAYRKRRLRLVDNGDGTVRISGLLSSEDAATVRTALDPLAAPSPAADGERDTRAGEQRLADALVELCRRHLQAGTLPSSHGHRPQLLLLAELTALMGAHRDEDTAASGSAAPGGDEPTAAGGAAGCGSWSRRWLEDTWAARFGVAPGELAWGDPVSTETLRRLCCAADVTSVLVDPHGVPLRVGRAERTVTAGIYTALVTRDRGCAFPTCTRPPAWCHGHHIRHWADGGDTDMDNMVLLCGHHHRVIHHGGWDVRMGPDGHPEFLPPPWVDPDRAPRRNTRPRPDHQPPPGHRSRRHGRQKHTRRHDQAQQPPPHS
ncbi:HNH endonuclease signature motif containing protein [Phytoactinopolyspora limicola]|uniref:HNH endonuclease signature motif containing protein n=1 Tax=Phytoactinopolyspora limicola TaxID=2715536 RepID=UPI00140C937E|nr:HNH endonuclease signature motif containing protein [Phytoactinopolyspora limicola]